MKKSIILAIFSYIFLISSVRFVYSSVFSNLDLSHLILAFCLFFISIIILVIEKPLNQSYKNRKIKNSFYIIIIKIILFLWIIAETGIQIYLGIKERSLFFPLNPSKSITHYIISYFAYITGAFTEELLFRYLIYQKLLRSISSKKIWIIASIILTSLLFAIYHQDLTISSSIIHFMQGIRLNILYELYPNIILVSGYHLFRNVLYFHM